MHSSKSVGKHFTNTARCPCIPLTTTKGLIGLCMPEGMCSNGGPRGVMLPHQSSSVDHWYSALTWRQVTM
jgi:hypothetical protein